MKEKHIRKMNSSKVGDILKLGKRVIKVIDGECNQCTFKHRKRCRGVLCNSLITLDSVSHAFVEVQDMPSKGDWKKMVNKMVKKSFKEDMYDPHSIFRQWVCHNYNAIEILCYILGIDHVVDMDGTYIDGVNVDRDVFTESELHKLCEENGWPLVDVMNKEARVSYRDFVNGQLKIGDEYGD